MSSCFGNRIKISVFGQSHAPAIGVTIDGLPAGEQIDREALMAFLARRAPGSSPLATPRRESDTPEFLCGLVNDVTCGAPLTAIIRNTNTRSGDYAPLADTPRPAHADYTAEIKYGGHQDRSGGGHFSGRLTAPLCLAGGILLQLLERRGIHVGAHLYAVGEVYDTLFDPITVSPEDFRTAASRAIPTLSASAGEAMAAAITAAREAGDSIGGIVECAVTGLPAGIGNPMCDGLESRIASLAFAVPAVKGIEFGNGFAAAALRGSQNNDPFRMVDGQIVTATNNHGGILGGISSGMPILFRTALKPTPSIAREQETVSLSRRENTTLAVTGRHDPCIALRAVPVIEAVAAIAVFDALIGE